MNTKAFIRAGACSALALFAAAPLAAAESSTTPPAIELTQANTNYGSGAGKDKPAAWPSAESARAEATAIEENGLRYVGTAVQVPQPDDLNDDVVATDAVRDEAIPPSSVLVLGDGRMFEQPDGSEPPGDLLTIMDELTTEAEAAAARQGKPTANDTMPQPKAIIGNTDSRFRVDASSLDDFPFRAVGRIGRCTGTLIGPRHVLTAAHCLHDDDGNWYWPLFFRPGVDGSDQVNGEPRAVVARRAYVGYASNRDWDVGLMILEDAPETAALGRFGFWYYNDPDTYTDRTVFNFGYPLSHLQCPGQTCDGHMWGMSCKLESGSAGGLRHVCDTQKGHSGSPVYEAVDGSRRVLGVHWGSPGGGVNGAARIRPAVASDLCTWMSWWPSSVGTMPRCAQR